MSNQVLPVFAGRKAERSRLPQWKTKVLESVSGREYRARMASAPRYLYRQSYDVLRQGRLGLTEVHTLQGFFNQHGGDAESWLYDDEDDNTATAQPFGTGDGVTRSFQLVRTLGGFTEPVFAVNGVPEVSVAGVLQSGGGAPAISAQGVVTFAVAPTAGQALTWTGQFYWRCRFLQPQLDFKRFMAQLWQLGGMDFITCPGE